MGENSKIEWCHHTFNPWIGCTKVSPGCANCYAEKSTRARVLRSEGHETWGKGAMRSLTSETNWKQPLRWNQEAAKTRVHQGELVRMWGTSQTAGESGKLSVQDVMAERLDENLKPIHTDIGDTLAFSLAEWEALPRFRPRVFCASLSDWLDDEVPIEWLARLLQLIHDTPNLDWLLLTKRPENWRDRIDAIAMDCPDASEDLLDLLEGWTDCIDMPERGHWPENVWIGTTVEDQARADERIPQLLAIPAAVRFLSCEPMLGPVDLCKPLTTCGTIEDCAARWPGIHWVICGGESGPNARPMHPDWARSLRDQCHAAGVPCFFKQWGDWAIASDHCDGKIYDAAGALNDGTITRNPIGLNRITLARVGKKKAGRLLDGIEHNGFPIVKGGCHHA